MREQSIHSPRVKMFQFLFFVYALSISTALSHSEICVFETTCSGKIAPLLPDEYVTNFIQHKWDMDGFGVNHVTAGTIWHSYSRNLIRADTAQHDWKSNNATIRGPRIASAQISILNFTRTDGQVDNLIFRINSMQTSSCNNYTIPLAASALQLLPRDALRILDATYSGQQEFPEYGLCDKWTMFIGNVPATAYFTAQGKWIGYDFTSGPPLKASVVNRYFNMDFTPDVIDDEVFEGVDSC